MAVRNFSAIIEVTGLSSTVSSAACSGLHATLNQVKVNGTLKPGSGGEDCMFVLFTENNLEDILEKVVIQKKEFFFGKLIFFLVVK